MPDPRQFTLEVFQMVCGGLEANKAGMPSLDMPGDRFREWIVQEAYRACKARETDYPFCEVALRPTYASEGVNTDGQWGDLRVGGPDEGANHCWLFAEFAWLDAADMPGCLGRLEAKAGNLLRLGWKKSSALLVAAFASRDVLAKERDARLAESAAWNRPALAKPFVVSVPSGGGSVMLKAFDIKRDPGDIITMEA